MFETKVSSDINIGGYASLEEVKANCAPTDFKNRKGKVGGVVMSSDGKTGLVFEDDGFYNVIGGTASKKTRNIVIPFIYSNAIAGNSMIITDVKRDIYRNTISTLNEEGYKVIILNFDDPDKGDAYSPIRQMYRDYHAGRKGKASRDSTNFADTVFSCVHSEKDPYWEVTASSYLCGCLMTLWDLYEEDQATIGNVLNLHLQGEKKFDRDNTYMKKFYSENTGSTAWKELYSAVDAPNETRSSVFSVFNSGLKKTIGLNEELTKMMSNSSFEIRDLVDQKTALFIFANEQSLSAHSKLISAFIHQWYEILSELSEETNGTLTRNVVFVLDEFGNLPAIKDFETKVSLSRARGISWMIVLQSIAQLRLRYGKEVAETIISNTNNWVYMYSPDPEFRKYISDICGETYDAASGKVRNTLTASQLGQFVKETDEGLTECLFKFGRMKPFVSFIPDCSAYACANPVKELNLPVRVDPKREEIDFCAIVDTEEKKRKMNEIRKRETAKMRMACMREEAREKALAKKSFNMVSCFNRLVKEAAGGEGYGF